MPRTFSLILILLLMTITPASQSQNETPDLDNLNVMDFDQFLDDSYYLILRRFPETVIELSLQDEVGLRDITLNDVSEAYQEETALLITSVLEQLQARERDSLTPAQQISYDVYAYYLDDLLQSHRYRLYDFPVSFFITGEPAQTANFFTEIHPLETEQDARDYITRLSLVGDKFTQVADNVLLRANAGIILPRQLINWTMGSLTQNTRGQATLHPYYLAFSSGLAQIDSLTESERDTLLAQAEMQIETGVMPAYQLLADTMSTVAADAPETIGSWQYPDGDEYYTYALRHHTTTDLTADEIHEIGLQELERIHAEMRTVFSDMGFDSTQGISTLYRQLARRQQFIPANQVVSTYETLIDDAYPRLDTAFSRVPETDVIVIGGDVGGYYIPAALDGSRPGAFYATANRSQPYYNMPSLLYHETIPGHHLQIAWAQEQTLPAFRQNPLFTAYIEGWALYAERLAYELGWYEDDPEGNLGRLQYEAFRAARLVVDTGIHDREWQFDEASQFFANNTGFSIQTAQGQVARYTAWAGQATAYMIGMQEMLRIRDVYQSQQAEDYNIMAFHDLVLDPGSVPLSILEQLVSGEDDN